MKQLLWRLFVFIKMIPCYIVEAIGAESDRLCEKLERLFKP